MSTDWETLAKEKKTNVDSLIPKDWILPSELLSQFNETTPVSVLDISNKFLNDLEIEITESYTVTQLLESLKTELMFDFGFERAQFLDDYFEKNKVPFGPLHGLPISLKDNLHIPGYDSTLGFVSSIGNKSEFNEFSSYAKLLFDLGDVFYVKTNIPQTLMTADSENNIFGRTLNPSNLTWTAGGISGGEGALIKMRGSLIGIGTDIAGSIRIPSLCNGVYGFRPTSSRLPSSKQEKPTREVFVPIKSVTDPLSVDLDGCKLIVKETINHKPWKYDPGCLRIPYNAPSIEDSTKLKIGVFLEDSKLPVHPPIKRIIKEAADIRQNNGHSIEYIEQFPSLDESWALSWSSFNTDSKATSNDKLLSTKERLIDSLKLPGLDAYGRGPADIDELIKLKFKVKQLTDNWLEILDKFDVIIFPGAPGTAPPHDDYGIAPYTCIWNLIDFPAAIIPYGRADATIDVDDGAEYPEKLKHIYAHYDASKYDGGIGSIQVVAPHLEDEKLLASCSIIDKCLQK